MRLVTIIFMLIACNCLAGERGMLISPVVLDKSERDSSLEKDKSLLVFTFKNFFDIDDSRSVKYTMDGVTQEAKLLNNEKLRLITKPGVHQIQFFISKNYFEVTIDSLSIRPQFKDEYSIHLTDAIHPVVTCKPVIYLYPTEEINVNVAMNIKGIEPFIYPPYNTRTEQGDFSNSWSVKASPDGTISIGEDSFNYLFWEALQYNQLPYEKQTEGFVVEKENVIPFFEEKLTQAGFNSKEQADFISFWGPLLSQHESTFIHFEFNEQCDQFAEILVHPKPDNVYRLYIMWAPVPENYEVKEQLIPTMNRNGFTLIEWGGQQHKINFTKRKKS